MVGLRNRLGATRAWGGFAAHRRNDIVAESGEERRRRRRGVGDYEHDLLAAAGRSAGGAE